MTYYISKAKVATDGPKGGTKWLNETYLVRAASVTHAEELVYKDFDGAQMDFEVKSVSASKISKVIDNSQIQ